MKKILFLIICFLCIPLSTLAVNYDIKHFYIDASIKENGDMEVQELIVLKGTFNGYERDLFYKSGYGNYKASNLTNLDIYAKNVSEVSFDTFKEEFDLFHQVEYASNGDSGKYILTSMMDGLRARMYYSTSNKSTAFLIKYTLKDVGISHADCVEFYWNFIGDFEDKISDLQIRVNFPESVNKEDFHWWFHGPLTGNSDINSSSSVLGSVSSVNVAEDVDFRVLLPKTMFKENEFSKVDNENVKESIISSEDEIVANDLATIKKNKTIFYTFEYLCILYYIVLVILWIYIYKKYDKERKPKFINEYNREFIDDYNVEVIDYLMHQKITENAMSASIMNLIYKKNIEAEKLVEEKNGYRFTLKSRDNLNETENYLVDFLFTTVGSNDTFTTKELKKYASSTHTCNKFMSSYTKWQKKVIEDGKKEGFYDKLSGRFGYGLVMLIGAFLIYFLGVHVYLVENILLHTLLFSAFIFIIYIACIKRKSEKGIEHYARWNAFKKFLKDFGTFDTKELPEIILWERYLVYATIFGLAEMVEKAMNVKIKELEVSDASYYGNTYVYVHDLGISSAINSAVSSAYRGAQNTISRQAANASGGSFGGHGGGFSSGGGFGGGGGGGRGF